MVKSVMRNAELISGPWPMLLHYTFYTFLCSKIINLRFFGADLYSTVKETYYIGKYPLPN